MRSGRPTLMQFSRDLSSFAFVIVVTWSSSGMGVGGEKEESAGSREYKKPYPVDAQIIFTIILRGRTVGNAIHRGYSRLPTVARGHPRLPTVTHGHAWLPSRRLQILQVEGFERSTAVNVGDLWLPLQCVQLLGVQIFKLALLLLLVSLQTEEGNATRGDLPERRPGPYPPHGRRLTPNPRTKKTRNERTHLNIVALVHLLDPLVRLSLGVYHQRPPRPLRHQYG